MAAPQKQYGLITRKKPSTTLAPSIFAATPSRRLAAFASDSDEDSDNAGPSSSNGPSKVNLALGQLQKRQIQKAQEAAVSADPTIYQYDELYDDIKEQRDVQKVRKPEDKKPKYIERLLVSAETRKKEYERRIERQVQKERELEGEEFADKESFVTASYRAKLEEMKAAEEVEKRDEYLEAIGDVTKQRDLGGFYRHLYEQKMGPDGNKDAKKEATTVPDEIVKTVAKKEKRIYRKRTASEVVQSDEETEVEKGGNSSPAKKAHIQSNLDADSDFSIDSSDSEDEAKDKSKDNAPVDSEEVFAKPHPMVGPNQKPSSSTISQPETESCETKISSTENPTSVKNNGSDSDSSLPKAEAVVKVKVNIWLKRTVGDVLLGAIQRYYERKVAREG